MKPLRGDFRPSPFWTSLLALLCAATTGPAAWAESKSNVDDETEKADIPVMVTGAFLTNPSARRGVPDLNVNIVRFARQNLNRMVSDGNGRAGECTDLVLKAYDTYGAQRPPKLGLDVDYDWGRLIDTIRPGERPSGSIQPGDVLQFRDAKFEGRQPGGGTYWRSAPHHTAVVVGQRGDTLYVLHQNVNGKRTVQGGTYDFGDLTRGTVWAYRPIPRAGGNNDNITIESGEITAYRIGGKEKKTHFVRFRAGQRAEARTSGARTDLDLYVYDPSGKLVTQDRATSNNPSASWTARSSGTYRVTVSNYDSRPTAYTLSTNGDVQKAGLSESDASVQGSLGDSDAAVLRGSLGRGDQKLDDGSYYDAHRVNLTAGRTYTIRLDSGSFDPFLLVTTAPRFNDSQVAAKNDDGGQGTNALLRFTPRRSGTYYLIANSYGSGGSGSYTLSYGN